ncbi:glycosyl transferase [Paenibacillus sp. CAA11]|uniref:glycosyltransferase family 4 protein n=1 Tax=Paenibacillus sp. CAA11 TaxID=1532905 RepID=UPI000D3BA41C|nr:glycosyltransferase family 4 protein [Paenibacillus sp. CAA11]AWB45812.1 glycosyl transferase [Paenibacillus sp. CAA11]
MDYRANLLLFSHVGNTKSITGAEKLVLLLARRLSRYFCCTLVVPKEGELTRRARYAGIRTIVHDYPGVYSMYNPSPLLQAELEELRGSPILNSLCQLLEREQADLLLVNSCVNVLPALAGKERGVPVIWNINERITETNFTAQAIELIHSCSSRIIGVSSTVLERFSGQEFTDKVGLLPPSWEPEEYQPVYWPLLREHKRKELGVKKDQKLVGYISSFLIAEKGWAHFVDMALALCADREDVRFLVIGQNNDESYYQACMTKIENAGYRSRFCFIPYLAHVAEAYCAMDLVVIPSLIPEGFGMTAVEAINFGKPVCAYASGGLAEILQACGLQENLAASGNTAELIAKAAHLLSQRHEDMVPMLQQAKEKAAALYGPDSHEEGLRLEVSKWVEALPDRLRMEQQDGGMAVISLRQQGPSGRGRRMTAARRRKRRLAGVHRRRKGLKQKRTPKTRNLRHQGNKAAVHQKQRTASRTLGNTSRSLKRRSGQAARSKKSGGSSKKVEGSPKKAGSSSKSGQFAKGVKR